MSEPMTRANDASGIVTISEAGPTGMVTLRADLNDPKVQSALAFSGREIPQAGRTTGGDEASVLWMSPDELLMICAYDAADVLVANMVEAFEDTHSLVVNVSDARALFDLAGEGRAIREVLAKVSPADMRETSLGVGHVRRTRLAQVPAAFWFTGKDAARLICFRSVKGYVSGLLAKVAEPGRDVGYFG